MLIKISNDLGKATLFVAEGELVLVYSLSDWRMLGSIETIAKSLKAPKIHIVIGKDELQENLAAEHGYEDAGLQLAVKQL